VIDNAKTRTELVQPEEGIRAAMELC
jgi:hypothetical protein